MLEIFIPTKKNNYHAYLLRTPALILFILIAFLLNSVVGIFPVKSVAAEIVPTTLLELHNREREKAGLPPLKLNANLTNSAQHKAIAMLESNCWSHYCPEGKSPWDFFVDAGYNYYYAGENLAEGFFDNEQTMTAWMNSPTHRDNILRADFEEVGFGVVQGDFQNIPNNVIVVVHFGTPQPILKPVVEAESPSSELTTPIVVSPTDGAVINMADFDIVGTSPGATLVSIYDREIQIGSAAVTNGEFTYHAKNIADGEHNVNVVSKVGLSESSPSSLVNFRVDTRADSITIGQVLITANDGKKLTVQINAADLGQVSVLLAGHSYDFSAMSNNIWQGELPISDLQATAKFLITNRDLGEHDWSGELPTEPILSQASSVPSFAGALKGAASGGWDFTISRAGINAAFLAVMCILFGLDFTILSKTGLTSHNRSRTHLHFAALIVILLVTFGSSLIGNVGPSGLTSF